MDIRTYQGPQYTFRYCDRKLVFPKKAVADIQSMLAEWSRLFPYEQTYAQTTLGVPSAYVRLDGVLDESGSFRIFEIQDGAAWGGYSALANEEFRKIRDSFKKEFWPDVRLLRARDGKEDDDAMWAPRVSTKDALANECLLLYRYYAPLEMSLDEMTRLIARSIVPAWTRLNKTYAVSMGLAKLMRWQESDSGNALPWGSSFVLKPASLLGSKDVMIWTPEDRAGRATRAQIERTFEKYGAMLLQDFFPPIRMDLDGEKYNVMLRPYFGFNPKTRTWEPWGGVWTGRPHPNLRLHGSSDAISGPLILE